MRLAGEADITTHALRETLDEECSKKPRLLVLDVSRLTFIDSSALTVLVQASKKLAQDGGGLALVDPAPTVARLLRLTEIDQVLPVYASVEEAAAH
jgi:anti-sigma B factor antagonist